jgi:hypothetical protein
VPAEVRVPVGAGEAAAAGSPDVEAVGGGSRLRTVTEETFRQPMVRRRRWPWGVAALVLLLLAVPTAVILLDDTRSPSGIGGPLTPSATVTLTAAMGPQACAEQNPAREAPVVGGATSLPGEPQMMDGWVYYRDGTGFHIAVGTGWLASRIEGMICFRDPNSRRIIGVYELGRPEGSATELLASQETAWVRAADINDYERVGIVDLQMAEGGADLEYLYSAPDGVRMHGVNRLVRMRGRVFAIYWLTTQTGWAADRVIMRYVQPSFGVVR